MERWNAFAHVRVDLFGCIDIVAIRDGITGSTGIQTTSAANMQARRDKIKASKEMKLWVLCGNRIELHGWGKFGKGGVKKWVCRREVVIVNEESQLQFVSTT